MHPAAKLSVRPAKISPLPDAVGSEMSERVVRRCDFCTKDVEVTPLNQGNLERLSGPGSFYCRFCLRHGLHTKSNRNVLAMSFRGVIGYYYYEFYQNPYGKRRMYYSQIDDYVKAHKAAGLDNPAMLYDDETYLWFVNFERVGNSKRRIGLDAVQRTVVNVLTCFDMWDTVPAISMASFYKKYDDALVNFYQRRYRPDGRPLLVPTFCGCGEVGKNGLFEKTRDFTCKNFLLK